MANAIKWSALGTFTEVIHDDASAPTMKNLGAGSAVLGEEIDNTQGNVYGLFELMVRGASAFTAGDFISVYFILAADGTNYEDGSASVVPSREPDLVFPVRANNSQQKMTAKNVLLPSCKFKPLLVNNGSVAFTNTDAENALNYRSYTSEIQ